MNLEEIKAIPIVDIAQHLGLNIRGRNAHCFNHSPDNNPSLGFNLIKNRFKCYFCPDTQGSVIDLVMQVRNIQFKEAVLELTAYAGGSAEPYPPRPAHKKKKQTQTISNGYKSTIYKNILKVAPLEPEGIRYLLNRGIPIETAKKMGIGFLRPETYRDMYPTLCRLYGKETLRRIGLNNFFKFSNLGLSFLLFPYETKGQCRLIKARCLLSKDEAKAMDTVRFLATQPADIFYNQDIIETSAHIYLCEGEIDTLSLIQRGYPAIGIPGVSGFRGEWLSLLIGKHLILCLDNDAAGSEATNWFYEILNQDQITHSKFDLPIGMDVNSFFNSEKNKEVCIG